MYGKAAVFLLVVPVLIAATTPAQAEDGTAAEKKRLLIVSIPPTEKLSSDEAELLDGVLCAEADKQGGFTVLSTSSIEDAKQFNDFSFKSGGSGCEGGWCVEAAIQKYQPDLIVRTTIKKTGTSYEVTMKLLDRKGASTLGTAQKKLDMQDQQFVEKLGAMFRNLVTPKPPPQLPAPKDPAPQTPPTVPPAPQAHKEPEKITDGK